MRSLRPEQVGSDQFGLIEGVNRRRTRQAELLYRRSMVKHSELAWRYTEAPASKEEQWREKAEQNSQGDEEGAGGERRKGARNGGRGNLDGCMERRETKQGNVGREPEVGRRKDEGEEMEGEGERMEALGRWGKLPGEQEGTMPGEPQRRRGSADAVTRQAPKCARKSTWTRNDKVTNELKSSFARRGCEQTAIECAERLPEVKRRRARTKSIEFTCTQAYALKSATQGCSHLHDASSPKIHALPR
eukprot:450678-Pleurochrysis_carterae.AAC.1